MNDESVDRITAKGKPDIFWQDEILQVMYWMRGEGFGEKITIADLRRFLDADDDTLLANLSHLSKKNLVELDLADRYELTPAGVREGGRRFADEFDGMLKPGHYECDDPNCDCHSPNATPCVASGGHQH